jgi:hypothetical protein
MKDVHVKLNSGLPWQKQPSIRRLFTSKLCLKLRKERVEFYIWSLALYGAEALTLREVDQKYLGRCEMWCRRGLEISWTDVNAYDLCRVQEERNIIHTIK